MQLNDTVGILTGASRGIGARLATALADKGVNLALAARSEDALEETLRKVLARGAKAIAVPTDVTRSSRRKRLVDRARAELGPIDLLINNAGVEMVGYFQEIDPKRIDAAVATNLTSLIQLTRLVVPDMVARRRGHVVNIASAAAKTARPFGSVYAATKHGVLGFSWSLRAELREHGVEVSVVCPAYVEGEGMFAERAGRAGPIPSALKPVTVEAVVEGVLAAIERDRAETVIGPALTRFADVVHALSPELAMRIGRRSGLYRFLRREATGDP